MTTGLDSTQATGWLAAVSRRGLRVGLIAIAATVVTPILAFFLPRPDELLGHFAFEVRESFAAWAEQQLPQDLIPPDDRGSNRWIGYGHATGGRAFGRELLQITLTGRDPGASGLGRVGARRIGVLRYRIGWPWPWVEGATWSDGGSSTLFEDVPTGVTGGVAATTTWFVQRKGQQPLVLPYGVAVDAMTASLTAWLCAVIGLDLLWLATRTGWRRRYGRCWWCAYSLVGIESEACPECGTKRKSPAPPVPPALR